MYGAFAHSYGALLGLRVKESRVARQPADGDGGESVCLMDGGRRGRRFEAQHDILPVSYTHLTLPTIYSV